MLVVVTYLDVPFSCPVEDGERTLNQAVPDAVSKQSTSQMCVPEPCIASVQTVSVPYLNRQSYIDILRHYSRSIAPILVANENTKAAKILQSVGPNTRMMTPLVYSRNPTRRAAMSQQTTLEA